MVALERTIRGDIGYTLINITNYGLYQNTQKESAHSNAHSSPHSVPIQSPFSPHILRSKEGKEGKEQRSTHTKSLDAMGLTGEHQPTDYTEEIAGCVETHGADVHAVANLKDSGPRGRARWCKFGCGYSERKEGG